jgi:hypothetical protein
MIEKSLNDVMKYTQIKDYDLICRKTSASDSFAPMRAKLAEAAVYYELLQFFNKSEIQSSHNTAYMHDCDFIINGIMIDVKSSSASGEAFYDFNSSLYFTQIKASQACDFYIYVWINQFKNTYRILGMLDKETFSTVFKKVTKGSIMRDGSLATSDFYEARLRDINMSSYELKHLKEI